MSERASLCASRPQALLLGCIEENERHDQPVYLYGSKEAAKVTVLTLADDHGPLLGIEYFVAINDSLAHLLSASLPWVRRVTVNACARRGWIKDGGVDEFETQRLGTQWFPTAQTVRLRRIVGTERGAQALAAYRARPVEPDPVLGGVEREIVQLAAHAERLGYALVPVTDDAKRGARALARTPFAKRGWGAGPSTLALRATATGEVAVGG